MEKLRVRTSGIHGYISKTRVTGRLWRVALLFLAVLITVGVWAQSPQIKPAGSEPIPEPAVTAILSAFDKYEVVTMPEDHGLKDLDDFIFALVRHPAFPGKVNDVVL